MSTCIDADGVIEAAVILKANGALINTFTHGTGAQTVQLGEGMPTPCLRKFIADAQASIQQAVDALIPAGEATAIINTYIDGLFVE